MRHAYNRQPLQSYSRCRQLGTFRTSRSTRGRRWSPSTHIDAETRDTQPTGTKKGSQITKIAENAGFSDITYTFQYRCSQGTANVSRRTVNGIEPRGKIVAEKYL